MFEAKVNKGNVTLSNIHGKKGILMTEAVCVVKAMARTLSEGDAEEELRYMGDVILAMAKELVGEIDLFEAADSGRLS